MKPADASQTTVLPGSRWATEVFFLGLLLLFFAVEVEFISLAPDEELEAVRIALGMNLIADLCFSFAYLRGDRVIHCFAALCGLAAILHTFILLRGVIMATWQ